MSGTFFARSDGFFDFFRKYAGADETRAPTRRGHSVRADAGTCEAQE